MFFRNRLEKAEERMHAIQQELNDPAAVKNQNNYQKLARELAGVRPIVEAFEVYRKTEKELSDLEHALADKAIDAEMRNLCLEEVEHLKLKQKGLLSELEGLLLRGSDPNASRDVIVEIRAGTGGEEAALFAADLFRMYSQYATGHKLAIEVMDSNPTGKGGFREIIFGIKGNNAYSFLKYEIGIHRVQRVPETESSGRVHTSAVTVAVLPEVDETEVEIDPKDLKIDVYRASGAGGQHVNKTESAVRITHGPTGLIVSCQDERSQHKNKEKAMRVLRARIFDARAQKRAQEIAKERKEQIGSGDRSGKIRTYNFPDQRVTDHRIGLTLHSLNDILDGHLEPLVSALEQDEKERRLTDGV